MEPEQQEIELLLGEIPRATSAPPHFERASGSPPDALTLGRHRLPPSHSDPLPLTDDFPNKKLPSIHSDSCVPNLYHGLPMASSPLMRQRMPHKQYQAHRQSPQQQQQQHHPQHFESQGDVNNRLGEQIQQQLSYDEESIRSTLANFSLQGDPDRVHFFRENGNGYTNPGAVPEHSDGFFIESSMISPCRKPSPTNEPFGNESYSIREEPIPVPTSQKLQNLMRQGLPGPDWNLTMQATPMDRLSTRYLQAQQSPFQDHDFPQQYQSPMLPAASSRQSVRRVLRGSNSDSNGFQVNVVPQEELQFDGQVLAYIQQQKLQLARQLAEDRHQQQLQQRLLQRAQLLEQQATDLYASLQSRVGAPLGPSSYPNYYPAVAVPGVSQQASVQQHQVGTMAAMLHPGWSQPNGNSLMGLEGHGDYCRYHAQGHCIRGDACPFLHSYSPSYGDSGVSPSSLKEALAVAQEERLGAFFPNKIFSRRSNEDHEIAAATSGRRRKDVENGHSATNGHATLPLAEKSGFQKLLVVDDDRIHSSQQQLKFTTMEEVEGRIYSVAKDQHGCRFLQRKFDEGRPEDVRKIFEEIGDHIVELMTDPFGNYLVQKLLEVCNEDQRMEILQAVTKNDELVTISLNMHGTRAVQKLIETLRIPEQISMAISSLKRGVVTLIKDLNGNHVVQRCLQRLSNEDSQFIFDAAASHCVEIASHRHGCCVLQRCVDFASGVQRQYLVAEIAANALTLAQDPFGNYVVQYILELGLPWASAEVTARLEGSYPHLAMQKFSSNVVEKCLKLATEDNKARIVKELIASSILGQLLQDPYANYVIQSALQVTKGPLHMSLVDAIRPHVPVLRSSPYGKRILSRTHLKK